MIMSRETLNSHNELLFLFLSCFHKGFEAAKIRTDNKNNSKVKTEIKNQDQGKHK